MTAPKAQTVNAVTMEHGRQFAEYWFEGGIDDACSDSGIINWPNDEKDEDYIDMEDDICTRVFEAVKEQIAEAFVRIANAAIEEERTRVEDPLFPPRIETVPVVTMEQGEAYAEETHGHLVESGGFTDALEDAGVMTWPGEEDKDALRHFDELADEIRDRLHYETKEFIAEAFVRIASDVILRERGRH